MGDDRVRQRPQRAGKRCVADKVAVIKVGWCEFYNGDIVKGEHKNIRTHAEGHERYNFKPGSDGSYYGYTPPISDKYPPSPLEKDGWLLFILAKKPGEAGLYLVGWYENASFADDYLPRPEYKSAQPTLEKDAHGQPFTYIVTAPVATRIPVAARRFRFDGSHMRRAPIYYLRGNDAKDDWRETLVRALIAAKRDFQASNDADVATPPAKGGICGDPVRRKEVEEAAIAAVKSHYSKDYACVDRQNDCCGFDLLFTHLQTGQEVHVEVKGTSGTRPHFFMSANEYAYAQSWPEWRLAMVTSALDEPQLELMTYGQAKRRFHWEPFAWHEIEKPDAR